MIDKKKNEYLHDIERNLESSASDMSSISNDLSDLVDILNSIEVHLNDMVTLIGVNTQIQQCQFWCKGGPRNKGRCSLEDHP